MKRACVDTMNEDKIKIAFVQRNPDCGLGAMYIASAVKTDAICTVFIREYEDDLYSSIERYAPDVVAYSTFTGEHEELLRINREIKKRMDVVSVFGGPHPTYNPDFINEEGVDIICRGEGEYAMVELVKALKVGADYHSIQNLHVKDHSGIVRNEVRNLVADLDALDHPDRSVYDRYFHIEEFKKNVVKRVITSRGCPFNCSYCYNHLLKSLYANKGAFVRMRSVDNVIDELSMLRREYDVKDFSFVDDLMGMKIDWFKRFSTQYSDMIAVPFVSLAHLSLLSEEYVECLKRAGCRLLCMGVECGDESYRREVLKRDYKNSHLLEVAHRLHRHQIPFYTLNITLLPGETMRMALQTLKLNMNLKPFSAEVYIYQPYPGTELASYARSKSYYDAQSKMIPDNLFTSSVLRNPQKARLQRMFYLFPFTARFKMFYPLMRVLVYLPFDSLYRKLHDYYKEEVRRYYTAELGSKNPKIRFLKVVGGFFKASK